MRHRYSISILAKIAKVTRSGYYKWLNTEANRKENEQSEICIKEHLLAINKVRPYFGCPRITVALRKEGFIVNHKKVYRMMKELNIASNIRRKRRYHGHERSNVFPNVVNREFKNRKQNEVLVTDITYLPFQSKFLYLSVILDIFNNEIISWKVSERNDLSLVLDTVKEIKKDVSGAILHSDQGFQYTSKQYSHLISEVGFIGSHSRKGNCLDNACVESFFSHFKTEKLYQSNFKTEEELRQGIEDYVFDYNHYRFQKRLGHLSPIEYRIKMAA